MFQWWMVLTLQRQAIPGLAGIKRSAIERRKGFECEPEQESYVLSPRLSYLKRFFHMYFFIGSIYVIQGSI
jgi:hypothetical protein